jgi:hypothetical protein
MPHRTIAALLIGAWSTGLAACALAAESREVIQVRISFGHRAPEVTTVAPHVIAGSPAMEVTAAEKTLTVGAGAVDAITAQVLWQKPSQPDRTPHQLWAYLLEHGTPDQIARLRADPGLKPEAPVLTVMTAADGTRGFSFSLEQLAQHKALWLPHHDAFITLANEPIDFAAHVASLTGERVLDRVQRESEATLADFTARWEDVGNPYQWTAAWQSRWLGTVGHLVGTVARHGALYKFGVDRWGNVRPDHASPHKFRFDLLWPDGQWKEQRIVKGLPILVTSYEHDGQRYEVEQFASPLQNQTTVDRGEIASVFLTRIQISGAGPVRLAFRLATENKERHPELCQIAGRTCVRDRETGSIWLMLEPGPGLTLEERAPIADDKDPRSELDCVGQLAGGETREIVCKLASPVVATDDDALLAAIDYSQARAATDAYWEDWLARGAQFEVPEAAVNNLFRANLWHALTLPRFRGRDQIDLPYSNFAYGQLNADWPINQAVYVDYMLYGLRGYYAVAEEEFAAMFRSQQKPDGRVSGYAEWGVNSPAMLYSIAQNYLLSRDRAALERLLPAALKTLDWCLAEVAKGQKSQDAPGLIVAPLNDLTHDVRAWGFPNAYFVAGLATFGRALAEYGHPRAQEVQSVARKMRIDVERAFARASVKSPVVQLADGTWNNYVPCDALTPRRLLEQWYPTDVDGGPLHLARLSAIDPRGWLATAMLHDHEDNLFLHQWGAANEPVYNQQGTVYLLRDQPEAAIRTFYSMTACAFSHHQCSPLEHRWAWGQYFCPPSTDGAWFELYRNLLLNELGDGLTVGQAVPRAWLADGQRISVRQAPTYFGPVHLEIESTAASGRITARVEFGSTRRPPALVVRLRHPSKAKLRSVTVNDAAWTDFNDATESVRIANPSEQHYTIVARY